MRPSEEYAGLPHSRRGSHSSPPEGGSERGRNEREPCRGHLGGRYVDSLLEERRRTIAGGYPDSRIVVMPGQGHAAMDTAADLFTSEVLRFLQPD